MIIPVFNQLKKFAILVCIALTYNNSFAQYSSWEIKYEEGIPVSAEPILYFDVRERHPLSFSYKPDENKFVIKGRILRKSSFLELESKETQHKHELFSIELEVLDDFGIGLQKTILLVPDTCGGQFGQDDIMNLKVDEMVRYAEWYQAPAYFFFYRNEIGQYCYSKVIRINDNRVEEKLTRWNPPFRFSKKEGMTVQKFEKRLRKILIKRPN